MAYLFLTFIALAIVAFASPPVAIAFCTLTLVIPATVKVAAQSTIGMEFSFGEAARAVAYSFGLAAVFLLVLVSIGGGTASLGPVLIAVLGACYVLGFKLALGTAVVPSIVIASISTAISGLLIFAVRAAL